MGYRAKTATRLPQQQVPRLFTPEEVSERLGVALQTLAHWRVKGCGPKWCRLSARCVRYPADALELWLSGRQQASTAENSH